MLKFKILSAIAVFFLINLTKNTNISNDLPVVKISNKIEQKGAITSLNDQNIYINFFGYDNMPDPNTIWHKSEKNNITILQHINPEKIKFIQKWNFQNINQPILEVFIIRDNKNINLRHELIVTSNNTKNASICLNFENYQDEKQTEQISLSSFVNQKGWISINNSKNVFAIKIDGNKFELSSNTLKIFEENLNTDFINKRYQFHNSGNQYFILKNQKEFKNLEKNVNFGYYLYIPSKTFYVLFKKTNAYFNNIILSILSLILLLCLIMLPFSIESIQMQKKLENMQPEIDAINNLPNLTFSRKQQLTQEIHSRYRYSQMKHMFGQVALIIFLSIFQSVFAAIEFINLIPTSLFIHSGIIALLCITIVVYNHILYKNTQPFITAVFTLLFINYPILPLLGFIMTHWINLLLLFIYRIKIYDKN